MFRFEKLEIWKEAVEYAKDLYEIADTFPREELYGLISQMKRAGVSVSNNIAEGSGAGTRKNFAAFLDISIRSVFETVNLLYLVEMRGYITEKKKSQLYKKAELLSKRITAFKNSLNH